MSTTVYDKNGQPYEADLEDGDKYRQLETELQAAQAEVAGLKAHEGDLVIGAAILEGARQQEAREVDQLRARVAELREDKVRLLDALNGWLREYELCSQEQREVGHSEMNVTVGLVLKTRAAIAAAMRERESQLRATLDVAEGALKEIQECADAIKRNLREDIEPELRYNMWVITAACHATVIQQALARIAKARK